MYIHRAIEETIRRQEQSFKAVLITGPRQVGKSTVLQHMHEGRSYLTFDDPIVMAQAKTDPGLFLRNVRLPVVLDEVQYVPELFPYIKMECDRSQDPGLFDLTGSQQYRMMKNVSESLAGRAAILELSGLSLREIRGESFSRPFVPDAEFLAQRSEANISREDIWNRIHRGSFPALMEERLEWQVFYSSYVRTYLERDVNDLGKVRDKLKFTQFLSAAAARTGQMLNYASIADQIDVSVSTCKEWVSILEASGIISILQPFSNSALSRTIRTPKLYFRDTGLVCYLTRYQTAETAMNGALCGALFETFVISEIEKSFLNAGWDPSLYLTYYRGKDKLRRTGDGAGGGKEAEIDLLIESGDTLYPVEIKMSANPRLSMTDAFDVIDRIPGWKRGTGLIVCMYDRPLWLSDSCLALPVEYI